MNLTETECEFRLDSCDSGYGRVADSCEQGDELLGYIIQRELLD